MLLKDWAERVTKEVARVRARAGADLEVTEDEHGPLVSCTSYEAIVATYGYVKYQSHANVLMRGQTRCFGKLVPSAYRGTPPEGVDAQIDQFLEHFRKSLKVDPLPQQKPTTEPVLQHYGVPTRWLDIVDSIPHALYFSLHDFKVDGLQIRAEDPENAKAREHGWLYLLNCGSDRDLRAVRVLNEGRIVECRGIWQTEDEFQLTDLRRSKPSKALRPHAQHGYLCRPPPEVTDLWNSRVLVRIRFPRDAALRWLGDAEAFGYDAFFPNHRDDRYYGEMSSKAADAIKKWKETGSSYDPKGILQYHDKAS